MFGDAVANIIGTVVGAGILAGLGFLARGGWTRWRENRRLASRQRALDLSGNRSAVLREQVVEVAVANSLVLPETAHGQNPTVVRYTDGTTTFFYGDHATYRRGLERNPATALRSFVANPPVPLTRWSEQQLEDWLAENAG